MTQQNQAPAVSASGHALRYPGMTLGVLLIRVLMLLLFRYVFGATLGAGIGTRTGGYINYLTPGIIVLAVSAASVSTAVA
jgi:ABC-2 type transport system permease protein